MPLPHLSRRSLLGSIAAAALLPGGRLWAQSKTGSAMRYGWDPAVEGPREASFHISPEGDDDALGTASAPLRSIGRGVALLADRKSGSLALHAGIYREAVDLDALRGQAGPDGGPAYRLHRFGADRVTISAAETLSGWVPCPAERAARFGMPTQGIYFTRLPLASLGHGSVSALNLHENGHYRPVAGWRASREKPTAIHNPLSMRRADFETRGERDIIVAIRDRALVGLDPTLLRDARVLVYRNPNAVSSVPLERFEPDTGTLHLPAEPALGLHQRNGERSTLYALQNVPMAMGQGDWYARREGAEVEVYFWPEDPAHLATGVEVSLRDHCIDFGQASSVELFGLEMIRAAGTLRASGCCVRRSAPARAAEGVDLRLVHCRAGENICSEGAGYGAIFLREVLRPVMRNCTLEQCYSHVGLALDNCREADLRQLHFNDISRSGARFFGLEGGILAFSLFENTGWDAHSNKFHFYLGSDRILVYGVRTRNTAGYVTYQDASRIHFAFCEFDASAQAQGRALVSQIRGPRKPSEQVVGPGRGDPVPGSTFWYWNLSLLPPNPRARSANSFVLGPENGSHRHVFHNCRIDGGGYASIYTGTTPPDREIRSHNHYTGLAHWQSAKYGWGLRRDETAGPVRTAPGKDMRPVLRAEIAALFPSFQDWDLDIDGRAVDWSAPPVGASIG